MEDEGRIGDHTAGIAATDGSWHHIAVSWSSHDGLATLYDNGHKVKLRSMAMPFACLIIASMFACCPSCLLGEASLTNRLQAAV